VQFIDCVFANHDASARGDDCVVRLHDQRCADRHGRRVRRREEPVDRDRTVAEHTFGTLVATANGVDAGTGEIDPGHVPAANTSPFARFLVPLASHRPNVTCAPATIPTLTAKVPVTLAF
jgi:hypothetical protein